MAGPSRPKPPSAFESYRRLERTRSVAPEPTVDAAAAPVAAPARTRARTAQLAGALRLVGFVTVLAIIVGTSVGLASADTRGEARRSEPASSTAAVDRAARDKPEDASTPAAASTSPDAAAGDGAKAAADTMADDVSVGGIAGAAEDEVVVVKATEAPPASAATTRRSTELPFTGERAVDTVLLGGAVLVLLGMLVQIAGQPLPAPARTRERPARRA